MPLEQRGGETKGGRGPEFPPRKKKGRVLPSNPLPKEGEKKTRASVNWRGEKKEY